MAGEKSRWCGEHVQLTITMSTFEDASTFRLWAHAFVHILSEGPRLLGERTMRQKLVQDLKRILGEQLIATAADSGWPLLCELNVLGRTIPAALYLGLIGASGRDSRPDELRMQNPASGDPIEHQTGRHSLLIGIIDADDDPVLVAWEVGPRIGRLTRWSAFLHLDDIRAARRDGRSVREAAGGERILAFMPNELAWAIQQRLEDDEMEEDELDYEGLGAALATLSIGEHPTSFPDSISAFDVDEIDWSTSAWLSRVAQVQDWLHLDNRLDLEAGPRRAAEDLFVGLAVDSSEESVTVTGDGRARLHPLGFTRLERRVALAQDRKERFQDWLDEGSSPAQATKRWLALWEDEPDASEVGIVQVHAEVDTWKIKDFKDQAEARTLELNPSYQRDIVWSNSDSQKLLDSVLRGIPLPSIILNKRQGSEIYEIVDGKQRLTAILRYIGHHPGGVEYAERVSTADAPFEMFRSDYRKWRGKLGIKAAEERQHCLPFRLSSYSLDDPLHQLSGKYYDEISTRDVVIQGKSQTVKTMFESPSKVYLLPVIVYEDTDLHQIHRVFGLYNKQGKQLNAEELRNAIYHHLDVTKLLLVLAGDNDRPDELVPFITGLDLSAIPGLLHELQVGVGRFHRTKLVSWVAAILSHPPNRSDSGINTPSTAGFIDHFLAAVTSNKGHRLRDHSRLQSLAEALVGGAGLFSELRNEEEAFASSFPHKKSEGAKWEDIPTVAAWTACTLAVVAGMAGTDAGSVGDRVLAATKGRRPLEKQQSRSQWGYLARAILELLEAMEVDHDELDTRLKEALGFSCLNTLRDIDRLAIPLE